MSYNFDRVIERRGTDSVKWDLLNEEFGRNDVLPMWVADMDFATPPEVKDALKNRADHDVYGYTIRPNSYYESITYWIHSRHNWTIEKESIINTPGIVPALATAVLAFTCPGDKVIIQTPVYQPFYSVIEGNGREIVVNSLRMVDHIYSMDFEDLESKIDDKVKMIILCNPHNPVGKVWGFEELEKLGEICKKNNIIILADEIHSDIIYKGHKHIPIASISEEISEITITCMAPSKTFNIAGLSTSYAIISNPRIRDKFSITQDSLGIGMGNLFGICALEAAYVNGDLWLNELIEYLQKNVDYMVDFVNNNIEGIKAYKPDGTYLAWLDCRELGLEGNKLKEFMIHKAKVGLSNGSIYGLEGNGFMRMNLGCPRSMLIEGLNRIKNAVDNRIR